MRLAHSAHTARPWLIHGLAPDFAIEDVWALPTPGGPDDFPLLVATLLGGDFKDVQDNAPPVARFLWWFRFRLGALLRLDRPGDGLDTRSESLRHRLPAELQAAAAAHPAEPGSPFTFLYETDRERAAEIANRTMHGVMHLSWVEDEDGAGGWHGQMAVLVKPNGRLGRGYMKFIAPFRHLIVYPAMLRYWERKWQRRWEGADPASARKATP